MGFLYRNNDIILQYSGGKEVSGIKQGEAVYASYIPCLTTIEGIWSLQRSRPRLLSGKRKAREYGKLGSRGSWLCRKCWRA